MDIKKKPERKRKLIRFWVPLYDKDGEYAPRKERDEFIRKIKEAASRTNGGYTTYKAEGGYLADNGELIEEPILVIETHGKSPLGHLDLFRFNRRLAQECMITMESDSFDMYQYDSEGNLKINDELDSLKSSFHRIWLLASENCRICNPT
jgi:hypothetical protein